MKYNSILSRTIGTILATSAAHAILAANAGAHSATGYLTIFEQPSWTTYDASIGVSRDDWTVSLDATNLTNVNKSLSTSTAEFIEVETPMRPQVIELNFHYSFEKHE